MQIEDIVIPFKQVTLNRIILIFYVYLERSLCGGLTDTISHLTLYYGYISKPVKEILDFVRFHMRVPS